MTVESVGLGAVIDGLERTKLEEELSPEMAKMMSADGIEATGNRLLPVAVDGPADYMDWPTYWSDLKKEVHDLLCSNSEKYSSVRKKITEEGMKTEAIVITLIAAAVGEELGLAAGVLSAYCALLLLAIVPLGLSTWCESMQQE